MEDWSYGGQGEAQAGYGGYDTNAGYMEDGSSKNDNTEKVPVSLLPVTIKQINKAEMQGDGNYYIDGIAVNQLSIVGQIMKRSPKSTHVSFEVEDGTGCIDARLWTNDKEENEDRAEEEAARFPEGSVVRMFGGLRKVNEKKSIVVWKVYPVQDFNEVTHHLLLATYVHLFNLREKTGQGMPPPHAQQAAYGGGGGGQFGSFKQETHTQFSSPVESAVYNIIRSSNVAEGASLEQIWQTVQKTVQGSKFQDVTNAIQFLNQEAYIFSTIDENHFRSE